MCDPASNLPFLFYVQNMLFQFGIALKVVLKSATVLSEDPVGCESHKEKNWNNKINKYLHIIIHHSWNKITRHSAECRWIEITSVPSSEEWLKVTFNWETLSHRAESDLSCTCYYEGSWGLCWKERSNIELRSQILSPWLADIWSTLA